MKKLVVLFALIVLPISVVAQDGSAFGIKGGLNLTNFYADEPDDTNLRTGLNLAIYSRSSIIEDLLFLQAEFGYTSKGSKVEGSLGEANLGLSYLELPVVASIGFADLVYIDGGGYVSYLLDANVSGETNSGYSFSEDISTSNFKDFDYGLAVGASVNLSPIVIGARYYYGLQNIVDEEAANLGAEARNSNFQVYVALEF
ncbi:MAG: porin family protein [Bacteroidota bacterium]